MPRPIPEPMYKRPARSHGLTPSPNMIFAKGELRTNSDAKAIAVSGPGYNLESSFNLISCEKDGSPHDLPSIGGRQHRGRIPQSAQYRALMHHHPTRLQDRVRDETDDGRG